MIKIASKQFCEPTAKTQTMAYFIRHVSRNIELCGSNQVSKREGEKKKRIEDTNKIRSYLLKIIVLQSSLARSRRQRHGWVGFTLI